jgi:hypothetical protein
MVVKASDTRPDPEVAEFFLVRREAIVEMCLRHVDVDKLR